MNSKTNPSDFGSVADSVFETLLTITTILSGLYIGVAFSLFGRVIGEPTTPDAIRHGTTGIILALIFILPLVFILMAWALAKFRDSITLRTVAWTGLIYLLAQDFIGLIAMFGFSLILAGVMFGGITVRVLPFVIVVPPALGAVLGYRLGVGYSQSLSTAEIGRGRHALTALLTVVALLAIQALFGVIGIFFGEIL